MTAWTPSLGEQMAERRTRLGLSQNRAAKRAGVSRTSWIGWEKATVTPEAYNHIRIETALQWQPGSVEAILTGGQPTVRDPESGEDLVARETRELARATYEQWVREYGKRRARQMWQDVLAELAESDEARGENGARGAG